MATKNKKDAKAKAVDVPPQGRRNPDPITDQAGAHPVETGVGAALGGAATGAVAGAIAGPVGAAVGAAAGAVAGGLAGKGVGEYIDPTAEDGWLRENFSSRPYARKGETFETYETAYRYGGQAEARFRGKSFAEAEPELKTGWTAARGSSGLSWTRARDAVKDAFDRTIQLREEQLRVEKRPVETGAVRVRKEVVTERKSIEVPVEREEVVIERHPVSRKASAEDFKEEEIRVPVKKDQVRVRKDTVVKEEVTVGKRKVRGTETASGTVRKEELKVEQEGKAKVRDGRRGKR